MTAAGWLVLGRCATRCGASNWLQERAEHHGSTSPALRDAGALQQARNGTESARHQWDFMDLLNHFWDGGKRGEIWEYAPILYTPDFWAGFPRLAMNLGRFAGSLLFRIIRTFVAASSGHGHQDSICMHLPFRSRIQHVEFEN